MLFHTQEEAAILQTCQIFTKEILQIESENL